ncbi:response regulator transcription factor [Streptococcus sciuri]|uniref:Response regulator transcription factor n=1 Tax=Streptococcus sciuri TaxID=2973939 RepID=A0ABT2F5X5_9STRE|nr:response regulator transcription factor [Streptococcus sciuri]MCS4487588.1 response regulator transcription factor [Streptococcus sciuri]
MLDNRIFIIEDDPTIIHLLKDSLQVTYTVGTVQNFRDVKHEAEKFQPDLILMDITLPYYNGFYWTTEIRKKLSAPIIFISSSSDEMDMVMALNMGGDDFISKPFSLTVLEAKIAAFLRRSQQQLQTPKYHLEGYQLNRDGVFSTPSHQQILLTPTESKMLRVLFEHVEQVVTKEELLESLWEDESFIDQNTLNVNMTRLRKKLTPIGFNRIHTVRGVGYLLR